MRLGRIMRRWRLVEDLGLREMAATLGISAATLSRFENGHNVDGATLTRIFTWVLAESDVLVERGLV